MMKVSVAILLSLTVFLTIDSILSQTDDVFLTVRRGPEPETNQGRPGKQGAVGPAGPIGPIGPPGPQGNCICDLTELESSNVQLQTKVENLTSQLHILTGLIAIPFVLPSLFNRCKIVLLLFRYSLINQIINFLTLRLIQFCLSG